MPTRKTSTPHTLSREEQIDNLIDEVKQLRRRVRELEERLPQNVTGEVVATSLVLIHEDTQEPWTASLVTAGPEGVCLAWDRVTVV